MLDGPVTDPQERKIFTCAGEPPAVRRRPLTNACMIRSADMPPEDKHAELKEEEASVELKVGTEPATPAQSCEQESPPSEAASSEAASNAQVAADNLRASEASPPAVKKDPPSSSRSLSSWRTWTLRLSCFWIPFLAALLLNSILIYHLTQLVPLSTATVRFVNGWLLICGVIALAVGLPSGLITLLTWKYKPAKLNLCKRWLNVVSFIAVSAMSVILNAALLSYYTYSYANEGETEIAEKLCGFAELNLSPFIQLRADYFLWLADKIDPKAKESTYLLARMGKLANDAYPDESRKMYSIYSDLANAYSKKFYYSNAAFYFKRALDCMDKTGDFDAASIAKTAESLAVALSESNHLSESLPYFKRAVSLANELPLNDKRRVLVNTLRTIERLNRFSEAEPLLKQLIPLTNENTPEGVNVAECIAAHYANTGNLNESEHWIQRAFDIGSHLPAENKSIVLGIHSIKAAFLLAEGKLPAAETEFKSVLRQEAINPSWNAVIGLACVYDKQKRYTEADFLYDIAENLKGQYQDSSLRCVSSDRLKRLLSQLSVAELKAVYQAAPAIKRAIESDNPHNFFNQRKFICLEPKQIAYDLRAVNAGPIEPSSGVQDMVLNSCIERITSKGEKPSWSARDFENNVALKKSLRRQPLPGTVLRPLTFYELLPQHFAIISDADLQSLKKQAKLSEQEFKGLCSLYKDDPPQEKFGFSYEHTKNAETFLLKKLKLIQDVFGEYSGPSIDVMNELGECYFDNGNGNKAREFFEKSLAISEKLFGKDSKQSKICTWNLTWLDNSKPGGNSNLQALAPLQSGNRRTKPIVFDFRRAVQLPLQPKFPFSFCNSPTTVPKFYGFAGIEALDFSNLNEATIAEIQEPCFLGYEPPVPIRPGKAAPFDTTVVQGVNTAGTVITGYAARVLLDQIPEHKARQTFEWADRCNLHGPISTEVRRSFFILDLRPIVHDFRSKVSNFYIPDQFIAKGESIASVNGGVVILGETGRYCVNKIGLKEAKKEFADICDSLYKNEDGMLREELPNKVPNELSDPSYKGVRTLRELKPDKYLILPPDVWKKLKERSGANQDELARIREEYGPSSIPFAFPPPPGQRPDEEPPKTYSSRS